LRRTIVDDAKEDTRLVEWYGVKRITFQSRLLLKLHASRYEPGKTKGVGVGYA
jgi:hypothetical protein